MIRMRDSEKFYHPLLPERIRLSMKLVEKYFSLKRLSPLYFISVVLHPYFGMKFVTKNLGKRLNGKTWVDIEEKECKRVWKEFKESRAENYTPPAASDPWESAPTFNFWDEEFGDRSGTSHEADDELTAYLQTASPGLELL